MPEDFDRIAIVVDWLDACRTRDVDSLLGLYAEEAQMECKCTGGTYRGRAELDSYWRPRLNDAAPVAFALDAIAPEADGVVIDYMSYEGKPVRIHFRFDASGKIKQTNCAPVPAVAKRNCA